MARGKDTSKDKGRVVDLEAFRNRDMFAGKPGVTENEDGSQTIDLSHPYWVNQANQPPDPPIHKVGDRVVDFRGEMSGVVENVFESRVRQKSHKVQVRLDSGELHHPNYEHVWLPDHEPVTPIPIDRKKRRGK